MKEMPQIIEITGISGDYSNEYVVSFAYLETGGTDKVAETFRKYPIKKYGERFPSDIFDNVVTDQNREAVSRLDQIADTANTKFTDSSKFTELEFKIMTNEVYVLVNGNKDRIWYPEVE